MTVSELIEWLKTQDQGATVKVVAGGCDNRGPYCYETCFTMDRYRYVKRNGQLTLLLGEMP